MNKEQQKGYNLGYSQARDKTIEHLVYSEMIDKEEIVNLIISLVIDLEREEEE